MTASSEFNIYFAPRLGRLNIAESDPDKGAWCPSAKIQGQWIQVNRLLSAMAFVKYELEVKY